MTPDFHGHRCAQIDSVRMPYARQMDLWPRGHLKTHIITMGKSIQEYLCDNNVRILLASASKDGAQKNLRKIKQIFESNTLLHWLFPECIPQTKTDRWAETEATLPRKANHAEPTFKVIGVGGHITGWHFDIIRKDDLIDEKTERSPEVMEKIIDWHLVMKNLLEGPAAGIDHIIGTRWAMFDLYQYVIKNEPEYTVNCFGTWPMEGPNAGQPYWPERFKREDLLTLREKDPYKFACSRGDQPILMADWTEKPISKVNVGDQVMGWQRIDGRQRLCPSHVLATGNQVDELAKITLASGRVTYQTFDHRWWQQMRAWRLDSTPYAIVEPGNCLTSCYTPAKSLDYSLQNLAAWLGGMFDADGTITANGTRFVIYQSMLTNQALCEKICNAFDALDIPCDISIDSRRFVLIIAISGRSNMLKFKSICQPHKLTDWRPIAIRLSEDNGQDRILSMDAIGQDDVFYLTTTTGNYVVSGFLSANCQQMNNPRDSAVTDFDGRWLRYYGFSEDAENILCEIG